MNTQREGRGKEEESELHRMEGSHGGQNLPPQGDKEDKDNDDDFLQRLDGLDRFLVSTTAGTIPHADDGGGVEWVRTRVAAQPVSGIQLFTHLRSDVKVLPTGCPAIDALLNGGLREGQHTEVVGGTCTGKTQLCHLSAVVQAGRGERVVYIDTANQFSPRRIEQIARSNMEDLLAMNGTPSTSSNPYSTTTSDHGQRKNTSGSKQPPPPPSASPPKSTSVSDVLGNITVLKVFDASGLLAAIEDVVRREVEIAQADYTLAVSPPYRKLSLLIIDSPTNVLLPAFGGASMNYAKGLTVALGRFLRQVANHFGMAILTTNWTTQSIRQDSWARADTQGGGRGGGGRGGGGREGATWNTRERRDEREEHALEGQSDWDTQRGALGESWRSQASVRLHLIRGAARDNHETPSVFARLTHSHLRAAGEGGDVEFVVDNRGLNAV